MLRRPAGCRCVWHCRRTQRCPESCCSPADGTSAAKLKKRKLRFVAVLCAALGQAMRLTVRARYASWGSLSIKNVRCRTCQHPGFNEPMRRRLLALFDIRRDAVFRLQLGQTGLAIDRLDPSKMTRRRPRLVDFIGSPRRRDRVVVQLGHAREADRTAFAPASWRYICPIANTAMAAQASGIPPRMKMDELGQCREIKNPPISGPIIAPTRPIPRDQPTPVERIDVG